MQIVPLQPVPAQTLTTVLGNQPCRLAVYGKSTGVFVDIYVNGSLVLGGVLALNAVRMVRDSYLGFVGDLVFTDTQPDAATGPADPDTSGLGARFLLLYLSADELTGDC